MASLFGMGVLFIAETVAGVPGVPLLAAASVVFLCLTLAASWLMESHFLAPAAVLPAAFVLLVGAGEQFKPEIWTQEFFYAAAIYAVFLAYPLVLCRRAGTLFEPSLAPVMASAPIF